MRVAVIGGGIVGLATAHRLLRQFPALQVTVIEKEAGPGRHQTGNNSGVLHCGLYYKPGSSKARLAVQGIRQMVQFCREHNVPFDLCGKIVVATRPEEIPRLHDLMSRGIANGLKEIELLQPAQIREIEPYAAGLEALRIPEEGIVDYPAVAQAMANEIAARGGDLEFSSEVVGMSLAREWRIRSRQKEFAADFLFNCAGLHCDRVGKMAGARDSTRIVPFRGEYYQLKPERRHLVRNLIYPVPDPAFPFLGVHFTRLIHGGVEAGPNAVLALAREGYRKTDFSLRDTIDALTYPGFWRFLLRYPKTCWAELRRSFSKELFCRSLQRLVPALQIDDLLPGGAGVRAQALTPMGDLLQDFYFVRQPQALHVLNAPSPAATASLAIANEIIEQTKDALAA
ncbi:MAG TPA: L-2-hydroxyglutarate oxidase [Terracidiphilus sp.]|nr:L-2-hydroxyglutarate oxidase [Terracidiphilus sp.]